MPKRNVKRGKQSDSPVPAKRHDTSDVGLHQLHLQSRELLQKVTAKRKAKWVPISRDVIDLVLKSIEQNKSSVCHNMSSADKEIIAEYIADLKLRIEEACQDSLAPPGLTDFESLRAVMNRHAGSLAESQRNLKQLESSISKLQRNIAAKEEELATLES